jgi:hypothetical protein
MTMTHLPDLSVNRQIAIWSITLLLILLVLVRAIFVATRFWRREIHYPNSWTSDQLRYLQLTGAFVGIGLILTWGALGYASPFLPWRYPFSQSKAILLIALLAQTYAWLVMVRPFDWNGSALARMKFSYVFVGMLVWWAALLAMTVYTMAAMALPSIFPPPPVVPARYAWALG